MNKSQIADRLAGQMGLSRSAAAGAVDCSVRDHRRCTREARGGANRRIRHVRDEEPAGPHRPQSANRRNGVDTGLGSARLPGRQGAQGGRERALASATGPRHEYPRSRRGRRCARPRAEKPAEGLFEMRAARPGARPRPPADAPALGRRRPGGASRSRCCSSPRARTLAPCRATRRRGRSGRATARAGSSRAAAPPQ